MPALTRLILETELADRDGGILALVAKPTTPTASPGNPTFTGPLIFACVRLIPLNPAIPGTMLDSDLAGVDPSLFDPLCDLAEYRIIKTCLLNFTYPNQSVSLERRDFNDLMKRFQDQMMALETQYAALLNIRRTPTQSGRMHQHFPIPGRPGWGIGRGTGNREGIGYPFGSGGYGYEGYRTDH